MDLSRTNPAGANSFAKAERQSEIYIWSGPFANEFAPTEFVSLPHEGRRHIVLFAL